MSEAFGGATDASAASSYRFRRGHLKLIDGSVATTETAACWVAVTKDGKFAYTTNTGSGSVTGYRSRGTGRLTLLDADGVTGSVGAGADRCGVRSDQSAPVRAQRRQRRRSASSIGWRMARWPAWAHVSTPDGAVGLAAF